MNMTILESQRAHNSENDHLYVYLFVAEKKQKQLQKDTRKIILGWTLFAVTRPWVCRQDRSVAICFYFGGQCHSYFGGQSFSIAYASMRRAVIIAYIFIFYILRRNEAVNK